MRTPPFDRAERGGKNEIGDFFPKRINSARAGCKRRFLGGSAVLDPKSRVYFGSECR